MIKHTQALIKTLYRPFVGLLFAFILVFSIGFGGFGILGPKTAEASNPYENNYIKFLSFAYNPIDDLYVDFYVKTSFHASTGWSGLFYIDTFKIDWYTSPTYVLPADSVLPRPDNNDFLAGYTYRFYLSKFWVSGTSTYANKSNVESLLGRELDNTILLKSAVRYLEPAGIPLYTPLIYFTQTPTLTITFPPENAEIAEAFYIQGTYSVPVESGFNKIIAWFYYGGLSYPINSYTQNLIYASGDVDIRVSGIQTNDWLIELWFLGAPIEEPYHALDINISIVERIPPELPETQETPPEVFDPVDADQFYLDFSGYETPTAMYNNLKNAIQPIFITIGSNLTFFTSRFDSEIAKDTGEKTGQAILIIRSYSSNLNTFFNDLPVSEFLLFYLTLLIVVIVFRIIKNLINLIKP